MKWDGKGNNDPTSLHQTGGSTGAWWTHFHRSERKYVHTRILAGDARLVGALSDIKGLTISF